MSKSHSDSNLREYEMLVDTVTRQPVTLRVDSAGFASREPIRSRGAGCYYVIILLILGVIVANCVFGYVLWETKLEISKGEPNHQPSSYAMLEKSQNKTEISQLRSEVRQLEMNLHKLSKQSGVADCPPNWISGQDQTCYLHPRIRRDLLFAESYCQVMGGWVGFPRWGGELALLHAFADNTFDAESPSALPAEASRRLWLGIRFQPDSGQWESLTHQPMSAQLANYWSMPPPTTPAHLCCAITDGRVEPVPCSLEAYFVCAKRV